VLSIFFNLGDTLIKMFYFSLLLTFLMKSTFEPPTVTIEDVLLQVWVSNNASLVKAK
jgi:hypothetical protein